MDCKFCGDEIQRGRGKLFVHPNGQVDSFCSKKCEKNLLKLGRKPREVKWTKLSRKARGKTQ